MLSGVNMNSSSDEKWHLLQEYIWYLFTYVYILFNFCAWYMINTRTFRGSWRGLWVRSRGVQNATGWVGSGKLRKCSKSHGSGRVASRGVHISWVGSGRVKSFSNLTGRVRSGQEVGGDENLTGRVRSWSARSGSLAGRASMTRELFSTDPRVGPVHSARGPEAWIIPPFSYRKVSLVPILSIIRTR